MAFDDDLSLLSPEDRFCRELGDITGLHQRLHSWIFKLSFEGTCDEIIPNILGMSSALYQLLHSAKFKGVLKLVLHVGNFLNNTASSRQSKLVYGFRLQSLAKLLDVKSVDGSQSLLDFFVDWVASEHQELVDFPADLTDLPGAVKVAAPPPPPPLIVLESANPRTDSGCASGCTGSTARATAPSPGRPTPGVVKQDKSSGGSVDTTKTRSGPQRVRMCIGERPMGAAKGKQSDTEALCQPPPPDIPSTAPPAPPPPPRAMIMFPGCRCPWRCLHTAP